MNKFNILVSGCGGDIGQNIIRILKSFDFINNIIGTDINENHYGLKISDLFFKVSKVYETNYLNEISDIILKNKIQLWIPASEPELRFFTNNPLFLEIIKIPILMASREARKVGFDKFETINFLKQIGLSAPQTFLLKDIESMPCSRGIIKDRFGAGSKNIFLCEHVNDFYYLKNKFPNFIFQEYIDSNDEFTCGIYKHKNFRENIIFKRVLSGGYTSYAEKIENDAIFSLLNTISDSEKINGAINVQLRLSEDGVPLVFEINPRFSSTVGFRHLAGFQDLYWSVLDALQNGFDYMYIPNDKKFFYKTILDYCC